MTENENEWLIEFVHDYDDGFKVTKRGLDATALVIKKHDLAPNEVMAFSCHQRANKAMTVFHFHPEFPFESRWNYMRGHEEGHELAVNNGSRQAAERAQMRKAMEERLAGLGRGLAVGLQTAALYIAAGGPAAR